MRGDGAFFGFLPSPVRYDERLNSEAKVLYAEISAICNALGGCDKPDRYFSEILGVSPRSVRRYIEKLQTYGYVKVSVSRQNNGVFRKIYAVLYPEFGEAQGDLFKSNDFVSEQSEKANGQGIYIYNNTIYTTGEEENTGNDTTNQDSSTSTRIPYQEARVKRLTLEDGGANKADPYDKLIDGIIEAYPLTCPQYATRKAIAKAVKHLGKINRMTRPQALEYLLVRTRMFAEAQGANLTYTTGSVRWFGEHRYLDPPDTWKPREGTRDGQRKTTDIGEADYTKGFF